MPESGLLVPNLLDGGSPHGRRQTGPCPRFLPQGSETRNPRPEAEAQNTERVTSTMACGGPHAMDADHAEARFAKRELITLDLALFAFRKVIQPGTTKIVLMRFT